MTRDRNVDGKGATVVRPIEFVLDCNRDYDKWKTYKVERK